MTSMLLGYDAFGMVWVMKFYMRCWYVCPRVCTGLLVRDEWNASRHMILAAAIGPICRLHDEFGGVTTAPVPNLTICSGWNMRLGVTLSTVTLTAAIVLKSLGISCPLSWDICRLTHWTVHSKEWVFEIQITWVSLRSASFGQSNNLDCVSGQGRRDIRLMTSLCTH